MCEKRNMSALDYRSDMCYVYVNTLYMYVVFHSWRIFFVVDKDKDKITPSV